jgi:hypothetical protein
VTYLRCTIGRWKIDLSSDEVREAFRLLVYIQNRCRVRRYSGDHEISHLRPFTFGHTKRALGKRPTLQGRFHHAPSPDHPRQQQGRTRLDNSPLVGMRLP